MTLAIHSFFCKYILKNMLLILSLLLKEFQFDAKKKKKKNPFYPCMSVLELKFSVNHALEKFLEEALKFISFPFNLEYNFLPNFF